MHKKKKIEIKEDSCFYNFYYKKDRLNQLRGFCTTFQCDFSANQAATKLHLEPGTICKQINSLEDELGIRLFDRTPNNRYLPTEEGRKFYEEAIKIIQATDGLYMNFCKEVVEERKNKLKIAGSQTVLCSILPKYIKKLRDNKNYKDINIEVINIDKESAIKRLKNNSVDIAIYPSKFNEKVDNEVKKNNVFNYKHVLVLNEKHPLAHKKNISEKELSECDYFFLDEYRFYDPRDTFDLTPSNITFENANLEVILALVEKNLGVIFMEEKYVNKFVSNNLVVKELSFFPILKTYFSVYTKKNSNNKDSTNFLINEMKKDKNN